MDSQKLIELGERMAEAFNSSDWGAYSAPMTNDTLYESPRAQARGPEQILEFVGPIRAPWKDRRQRLLKLPAGVHRMRIDRQAGVLPRKARALYREPEFAAHEVHDIGRVGSIEHCE